MPVFGGKDRATFMSGKCSTHGLRPALVDCRYLCNLKVAIAKEEWAEPDNGKMDSEQMRQVRSQTVRGYNVFAQGCFQAHTGVRSSLLGCGVLAQGCLQAHTDIAPSLLGCSVLV